MTALTLTPLRTILSVATGVLLKDFMGILNGHKKNARAHLQEGHLAHR